MRDDLDLAYDYDRPSRVSRVVILLSTLGVAAIAIWVFTPILRAHYTAYTSRTSEPQPAPAAPVTRAIAAVAPAAPAAPAPPASDTTAAAVDEPVMPPAIPPALRNFNARAANAWPNDPPTASLPPAFAAPSEPASAPTARRIDPPAARANDTAVQLAAVSAAAPAETADVPLPRARPNRLIAARLAIPLPRPRPDIPDEAPAPPTTFDLQVERMR